MTILRIKQNAWIIEPTIEYIITKERFITPLSWIHLSMMMMNCFLINCFCGRLTDERRLVFDTPEERFQPAQNLSSGLVELSCVVVITTTPTAKQITTSRRSKSPHLLKSLIDSKSPWVILFSCLVGIISNVLLNVYHQGYAVGNLF